nr:phage tail assembly chaperone [Falsiroseomonas frigidaquae]
MLEQGCGWLRWPPAAVWDATLAELCAALNGWQESKTGKNPRLENERMAALYAEAKAAEASAAR